MKCAYLDRDCNEKCMAYAGGKHCNRLENESAISTELHYISESMTSAKMGEALDGLASLIDLGSLSIVCHKEE